MASPFRVRRTERGEDAGRASALPRNRGEDRGGTVFLNESPAAHGSWIGPACALVFFFLGCVILPYPGVQNDEAIFAPADYQVPGSSVFLFHRVPLMLMSYLGALKTWIYAPLLWIFPPSSWTVRLPMLLVGALTIWLFVKLLEEIHSPFAALAGGILLATDTMFLVTTCFDWGPVALQHLLLIAALLLLARFALRKSRAGLFWGFFCLGLGLWDKALLFWNLSGLGIAALLVFPRDLRTRFSARNGIVASAGLALGALPLIVYNLSAGFATFRSNSTFRFDEFASKFRSLRGTWDGSALLGYIASLPGQTGQGRAAQGLIERLSYAVHSAFGDHPKNRLEFAFVAAVILALLLWRSPVRKLLLLLFIALAIAWLQMAITKDAGASAHHVVLLWPLAYLFLVIALAEAAVRWGRSAAAVVAAAVLYLAAQNLLVTNQHLYLFARYGSPGSWSDAIYALSDDLGQRRPSQLLLADWGMVNQLVLFHRNALPLAMVDEAFLSAGLSDAEKQRDRDRLEHGLWVGHTPAYRELKQVDVAVVQAATAAGFRKQIVRVISDTHGSAAFEIFRFVPAN